MTIQEIRVLHDQLRNLDTGGDGLFRKPSYKIFGADAHEYNFNNTLSENEIFRFEQKHGVSLPTDYRNFLTEIGNGGSGPAYGLFRLKDWDYELEIVNDKFLSTPFPHQDAWNLEQRFDMDDDNIYETEQFQSWELEYYSDEQTTGSMRICHYGCAIYYLLVVTGEQAGYIWVDDRASDYGIYPAVSKITGKQLTFLEWYGEWLRESLDNIELSKEDKSK